MRLTSSGSVRTILSLAIRAKARQLFVIFDRYQSGSHAIGTHICTHDQRMKVGALPLACHISWRSCVGRDKLCK